MDSAEAAWWASAGPAACTVLAPEESDDHELERWPGARGPARVEGNVRLGATNRWGPYLSFPWSSRCRIQSGRALTQLPLFLQRQRGA